MKENGISIATFDCVIGKITYLTLRNQSGASVTLSSVGAGIVSVIVPDCNGNLADVVLGYGNPADYIGDGPCAGKIPGRYANRISNGEFMIDGETYHLAQNDYPNALHGGPSGFHNRIWDVEIIDDRRVRFTLLSEDGDEGYPGNLSVSATYVWTDGNMLELHLEAVTDKPTVGNLTNHAYFNLDGEDAGSVLGHELWLNASRYLPTDSAFIPTGELADVVSTPMDFTSPKRLGMDIEADFPDLIYGRGYNTCWIVDNWQPGRLQKVAVLDSERSGRRLTVFSTQPGVQVYTGGWLKGSPESISGGEYDKGSGVAIECQGFPDAPNRPSFPSQLLRPGERYCQQIFFSFSTRELRK
ncbi:aldose epimerase family protein [Lepagella muris]|jgi:aldose 1-epimerase|uniref:Galactose mutarotase n=1 Tax=Lepagella muris TaxID=3032870 RepID=A0AC61REH8_9BACT|nr:aldose epimerase family protein [Lepagella muris]ROT09923.1 galactose mutarotase [Muribaculaceae bacterium Isolate-037 (Harlan)]TGY77405.1 galactose mutarotase [Lepagella muris]THG51929.1 galactose mutarotase [Bacteroidales bacterium]TKC64286.1 galactose mutarotase [Bacteroidales bacterium]